MSAKTDENADAEKRTYHRKSDVRYGGNCPGIVELTFRDEKHYIALTGRIVNLSITGCLFTSGKLPWENMDITESNTPVFDIINEACRVYMPWTNTHRAGKIRRLGTFIIGVEFLKPLDEDHVKLIASLEPGRNRRFRPRNPKKYNRVLPLALRKALTRAGET